MGILSGIVVYLLIWWTLLFAVLPWGIERHKGEVAGADPGAPQHDRIKKKFIATSIVSAVVWLIIFFLIRSDLISFRVLAEGLRLT